MTKLIILDLDETLIHATETPHRLQAEPSFQVNPYHIVLRPHLDRFLNRCFASFEVAVWTASSTDYAAEVVHNLFTPSQRRQLRFVWARPRCTFRFDAEYRERYCIKNLRKVKRLGYDLGHVLAVDDTPRKYERSYGNLVPVEPFFGDPNDRELPALIHYLEHLRDVPNVRVLEKRGWRLAEQRLHN